MDQFEREKSISPCGKILKKNGKKTKSLEVCNATEC